jgi:hypothetical protein
MVSDAQAEEVMVLPLVQMRDYKYKTHTQPLTALPNTPRSTCAIIGQFSWLWSSSFFSQRLSDSCLMWAMLTKTPGGVSASLSSPMLLSALGAHSIPSEELLPRHHSTDLKHDTPQP